MSQADLARIVGTTNVSISRYEKEPHRVTLPMLEKIAGALRVSPAELITAGCGEAAPERAIYIPLVGQRGKDQMAFDADIAAQIGRVGDLLAVRVEDDAMEPTLRIGDLCIVDSGARSVTRDGLYVLDGGAGRRLIRRVAFNPIRKAFVVSSDNRLYADVWDIHEDEMAFLGRVVYAGRAF